MLGEASAEESEALRDALRQVYIAADEGLGQLINAMGPDANVMAFSLHGVGANQSRHEILGDMLSRILADKAPVSKSGPLDQLRALLPAGLRSWVKRRLPIALQDRLTLFWRTRAIDWTRTSAFANFSDLHGYIRINRLGRERAGIVAPEEYEALRDRTIAGLSTFVDADTGKPIVEEARRIEEVYPSGAMLEHLPDIVVRWMPTAAAAHRSVTSPQFGDLDWPTLGRHPQGRSGNHRDQGFLIAAGPDIAADDAPKGAHILDLAPTALALLGLEAPEHMQGISLFAAKTAADAVH